MPPTAFLAAAFLFTWRLWTPSLIDRRWIVAGDFSNQFYPWARYIADELRGGRLPLWNPYVFGGHPFQADPQTALLYVPSTLLAYLFGGGGLPYRALELELPLHFAIGAFGAFLLARQLTSQTLAASVAGLAYGFGGFLTSYPAQQLAMLRTAVWIPWALFAVERTVGPGGRPVGMLGAAAAVATMLLAGHSQTAMFGAYLAAGYAIWRARDSGLRWTIAALAAAVPLLGGAAIAAVQLVPTLEFVGVSTRSGLGYDEASYGYGLKALPGIVLPGWRSEKALYAGIPALVLAVLAWRGVVSAVRFWWIVAALALVISVGGRTFAFTGLYLVAPGWGTFRDQERVAGIWVLAVAILAAYGVSALRREGADRIGRWLGAGMAVLGLFAVETLVMWTAHRHLTPNPFDELLEGTVFLLMVAAATSLLLWLRPRLTHSPFAALLCGLVAFDVFSVNSTNNMTAVDPNNLTQRDAALAAARAENEPYRLRADDDTKVPPNFGMIWRTPFIAGDSPIQLRRSNDLLTTREEWRLWQLFNVKYLLAGAQRSDPGLEHLGPAGDLSVYRVRFSLPRAWAVSDVRVVSSPAASLASVLDPSIHPGDTAIVEQAPPLAIVTGLQRPDVRVLTEWPNGVRVGVNSTGNALLVVADAWHPGWVATVDGAPTPILRTNHAFRGVAIGAGDHTVEMRYQPTSLYVGAAISGLAALTLISGWLALRSRAWP